MVRKAGRASVLVGGILVLAAVLRLARLSAEELWFDEAWTVAMASQPAATLVGTLVEENKPPLYPLAVHGWIAALGDGEAALRSLSALFGLLTVWLLYLLGRDLVGQPTGLIAALFAALAPIAVFYSREGRNYAMVAGLGLLAVFALHRALTTRAPGWWLLHGLALFGCVGTHFIAAPIFLVAAVQVALYGDPAARRRWALTALAAAVGLAPWLALVAGQMDRLFGTRSWVAPFWEAYPPALAIPRSLWAFLPGGTVPPFVGLRTTAVLQPLLVAGGLGLAALALWPGSNRVLDGIPRRVRALLLAYLLLPLLVPFLYSFRDPVYIVGRTDFVAFPAFCLLAATAVARLRPRALRAGAVAAFTGAAAVGLWTHGSRPHRTFERSALQAIARETRPEDVVVLTEFARPTAAYYLRRFAPDRRLEAFPRASGRRALIENPRSPEEVAAVRAEAAELATRLADDVGRGRRAIVLYVATPRAAYLAEALAQRFEVERLASVPEYRLNQVGQRVQVAVLRPKL